MPSGSSVGWSSASRPAAALTVLSFLIGPVRCGLPMEEVAEVLPAARLTPLPGAPAAVLGVLDVRGEVTAVLDGRRCLGLPDAALRPDDRFIVLAVGECRRALRVDAAEDLVAVPHDGITDAASVAPAALSCAGVARLPDGLLIIHDAVRFLSASDAATLKRALHEHTAVPAA